MATAFNSTLSQKNEMVRLENTYAEELRGCYVPWRPFHVKKPVLLQLNYPLARHLGFAVDNVDSSRWAAIFSGNAQLPGCFPLAQAYAGHQFGVFSPTLGDGRALLLGEIVDRLARRYDIALKGSGPTPFSRGGDGQAALGPVLREYLIGEAMHALGIPTTRALAAVSTGTVVHRDTSLPGAVLTRVAASHLRIGTFEFFAARGEFDRVQKLVDYAIRRHDSELINHPDRYVEWLRAIANRHAQLIAQWMHVGFVHGVMNTDNVTISGETIDYGPCAFMETHDPQAVFSSIDHQGRYAYGNQPRIAQWNLMRLAETVLPLIAEQDPGRSLSRAVDIIEAFPARYEIHWLSIARDKLGLITDEPDDGILVRDWITLLEESVVDHTLAWRRLADAAEGKEQSLASLFVTTTKLSRWLKRWRERSRRDPARVVTQAERMRRVNPLYIPRNHKVEEALTAAAVHANLPPFERLLEVVVHPFEEHADHASYAEPAPAGVTACYQTFCGT